MGNERVVLADLGWCIGKMTINEGTNSEDGYAHAEVGLTIFSPAGTSVCIFGRSNLVKLQAFLNDNFNAKEVQP